jgi:alpha-L-arabinofuranosidase
MNGHVDSTYWKCYTARFAIEKTDDQAVLLMFLKGTGIVHIDQVSLEPENSSGTNPETNRAIATLNPPLIRFPGGCMSTTHQWRYGTGPRELRPSLPDPVFKWRTEYDYGTDEYLEQCRTLGIAPHITVNIGDTPEEAAAWAAYCWNWFVSRGVQPPPAYFQMGNEQYGLWEISHMTADMYVSSLKAFVPGVRAAYPGARIIALAEEFSGSLPGEEQTPLRKTLLSHAKGLFDVLAIHCYKGQWFADPEAQCQNAAESAQKVSLALDQLAEDCRLAGWEPRLAITEWNYWLKAAHWDGKQFNEPDDAIHAIFFSGVVHTLLRKADVMELASYYHLLVAMGLINKPGADAQESAIGRIYRLYRTALPGKVLSLQWSADPALDSVGILHKEGTSVFLCNASASETVSLEISPSLGMPVSSRTFAAPDCHSPMKEIDSREPGPLWELPPLSLTRLDFKA